MGSSLAVIGLYMNKEQVIRLLNFFAIAPWIAYNLFNNNIPALINSCLGVVSVLFGLIFYYIKDRKANTAKNEDLIETENLNENKTA